ncbi:MAG: tetratricopeptide repeat protein [Anaerolineae bacterium]|nr:tetratricopeptide repeat protein [Gemmatimonadaceae bacterium]
MTETIETRWEKFSEAGRECASAKQYDKAEEAYLAAMRAAEHFGDDDPRLPATLNALARVYCMRNKFFPAAALLHRLVAIAERTLGDQHPRVAGVVANLAEMYARLGDIRQELTLRERAHAIRKNSGESDDASLAKGYERLVFLRRKHAEATGQSVQITPAAAVTPVSVPASIVVARPTPETRATPAWSPPIRQEPVITPVSTPRAAAASDQSAESGDDRPFEPLFIDLSVPISEQIRQPVAPPRPRPAADPFIHVQPRAVTPPAPEPVHQRLAPEPLISALSRAPTPAAAAPVPARLAPSPFINPPPQFEKTTPAEPIRQRLAPEPLPTSESRYDPTPDAELAVMPQSLWERLKSRRLAMVGGGVAVGVVGLWIAMSGGPDGAQAAPAGAPAAVVVDPRIEQNRIAERKKRLDEEAVRLGMAAVGALNNQTSATAAAQANVRASEFARTERRQEETQPAELRDTSARLSIPKMVNIDRVVGGIDATVRANVDSANKTMGYTAPTFKKP